MAKPMTHATLTDRVLWTLVLGATTGAAGFLAARLASWGWHQTRGEAPPEPVGPVHWIARNLGISAVASLGRK